MTEAEGSRSSRAEDGGGPTDAATGRIATAARLTPYELALAEDDVDARLSGIFEEAQARDVDLSDPERFIMLGSVGELLRELLARSGDHTEEGEKLTDLPPQAVRQLGRLLFHALHFWRTGQELYLFDPAPIRYLIESSPRVAEWRLEPPAQAGYLQLPRHLFWTQISEDAPPEPVDGFFWTMLGGGRLDVLLAVGLRAGRPGFGVVDVDAEPARTEAGHWADIEARPDGRDFANVLPGGEMEELYALTTAAEVLKLVSLCFWYMARNPAAVLKPTTAPADSTPDSEHALPPSSLDFSRVVLGGDDG